MGELIQIRQRDHETLGQLALEALEQGRPYLAILHLAQIFLDTAPDRERALPVAERLASFNRRGGAA